METNKIKNSADFWAQVSATCPRLMAKFHDWIDSYKEQKEWIANIKESTKFHDLPFEMQVGILIYFITDIHYGTGTSDEVLPEIMSDTLVSCMQVEFGLVLQK